MSDYANILSDLKKKNYAPIYVLYGDEPFFIDAITDYIENNVLDESERGFNQTVMYGKDCDMSQVVENAKRYPMMADKQVIIIKEAQHLSRQWDAFESYAKQPLASTVLVFNYKYKKPDARMKVFKEIKKTGIIMESKPLYENKVAGWIHNHVVDLGYKIDPTASQMLVEFIGNDLSRIHNEIIKLGININPGDLITPQIIEDYVGISKDYNNFELRKAIGARDTLKMFRIADYFAKNPKDNPIPLTTATLYSFFIQLLKLHACTSSNPKDIASQIGVSPFFVNEVVAAGRNYPMKYCSRALKIIRTLDVRSKGVGVHDIPPGDLLKEALINIIAP